MPQSKSQRQKPTAKTPRLSYIVSCSYRIFNEFSPKKQHNGKNRGGPIGHSPALSRSAPIYPLAFCFLLCFPLFPGCGQSSIGDMGPCCAVFCLSLEDRYWLAWPGRFSRLFWLFWFFCLLLIFSLPPFFPENPFGLPVFSSEHKALFPWKSPLSHISSVCYVPGNIPCRPGDFLANPLTDICEEDMMIVQVRYNLCCISECSLQNGRKRG